MMMTLVFFFSFSFFFIEKASHPLLARQHLFERHPSSFYQPFPPTCTYTICQLFVPSQTSASFPNHQHHQEHYISKMVKLDYDVISQAPTYWDAVKDRALDLRGDY
jgi:hypothetical protein